ncbi:unnamed protein product [Spirodela intermedia]|uniref:RING-type domain-containing protein n=1 Tax=Spirodela intermedia TaxID=51605 RepID=A0A7I8IA06_SPIIN|nr:unnamed protein product [Spirodela intermedia]CAA6654479.1 unnamed protein product [Spirodela intermedia]
MEVLSVLLSFPVLPFILLPFCPAAFLFADFFIRPVLCVVWHRCEDQLAEAAAIDCVKWLFGRKQNTLRYRCSAASEQAAQCVICLCDVEDGDEIRELKCDHVFHRCCLDRWVAFGRVTCPLCREALSSKARRWSFPARRRSRRRSSSARQPSSSRAAG